MKDFIFKHGYLILLTLSLVILFIRAYTFREVLFPSIAGLVITYLVLPVILWIENSLPAKGEWRGVIRVSLIPGFLYAR